MSRHAEESETEKATRMCRACGAVARRVEARYCSTCGHALGEDYFPTASLRASYRFERPSAPRRSGALGRSRARRRPARATFGREATAREKGNGVSATALAFVTYALVPYLGILFCPGALLLGGFGLLRSRRAPHAAARREYALSFALGLLILCAQLLLWWILYKVPEWSRRAPL
jgi:ribosomal protein L37E